jgi:hypothetical protein
MATSSYSNLFGTNGAGSETTSNLFGQQQTAPKQEYQPPTTFSQMQQQGMARPAPPQTRPYAQYGGSQQGMQARTAMLSQLQQQLAQPTRFDTQAFQQIRGAQQANLQQEYGGMQRELEERLARQGLSASTMGAGRYGDLAGQQARALASLDAQLLQQAAQTQAQDRLAAMQAAGQFADLAGTQDLQQFEANRVGQATEFEQNLRAAEFGQRQFEQGGQMGLSEAQLREQARQFDIQQQLQETMGLGQLGINQQDLNLRAQALQQEAAQQGRSLDLQQARDQAQREQFTAQFGEQRAARLDSLGISTKELDLRAQQLAQQAFMEGRSLDLQQARDEAEVDIRGRQIQQEALLQGRSLDLQQARDQAQNEQFASNLSQQNRQFQSTLSAEDRRFNDTLAEQRTQRLQQFGLSQQQVDLEAARIKNQASQFGEQLSFQQAQSQAEIALRTQQIQNEYAIQGRQVSVQEAQQIAQQQQFEALRTQRNDEFTRTLNSEEKRLLDELTFKREALTSEETRFMDDLEERKRQFDDELDFREDQLGQQENQFQREQDIRRMLGMTEATGVVYDENGNPVRVGTTPRLTQSALQQQQSLMVQLAGILSGATVPDQGYKDFVNQLRSMFGITTTPSGGGGAVGGGSGGWGPTGSETEIIPQAQ